MAARCGDARIIQTLTIVVFHGGKLLDGYGKYHNRTHNSLVHLINNCDSMDCMLEKR